MSNEYQFINACWGKPVTHTPIWIMRQAGRYMKEYMDVRAKVSFLELCKTPELATEVTLQPVDILGVDAAILFSDILIPLEAMGVPLTFNDKGPELYPPVRFESQIDDLVIPEPLETVPFVMDAIKMLRKELESRKVPLIGFSGAPFTLATYMVEGGTSKNFINLKMMMYETPALAHKLLDKITETVIKYLNAQIDAGAQAVQVFDTWGGILSPYDYERFALPYTKKVIAGLKREGVPVIHFVKGGNSMLELIKTAGSDVVGLDWMIELGVARQRLGLDVAVQGNLDPTILFAPIDEIRARAKEVLDQNAGAPGHIFNLGHGILPPTNVEHAKALVDAVHEFSAR